MLPFLKRRLEKEENSVSLLENGSSMLEELIACFGGRYENSIRCYTTKELITATNNFTKRIDLTNIGQMFQGSLKEREILVKRFSDQEISSRAFHGAVRDIVVSSQMNNFRNILKLVGCCLEFKIPALVYEYAGTELLANHLHKPDNERLLSWKQRQHIAKGIANAIAYLHTAFSRPIIFRDLKPTKVFIDKDGSPKLFDFSLSIRLPPGESCVEDVKMGTWGFVDPEYLESSIVTEKSDVYSFGVLLLILLTGEEVMCKNPAGGQKIHIVDYVKHHVEKDQFDYIVDSEIWFVEKETRENQLYALSDLAMKCTRRRGEDRPHMIEIAKELHKMGNVLTFVSYNNSLDEKS